MALSREAAERFLGEMTERREAAEGEGDRQAAEFYGPVLAYARSLVRLAGGEVAA